jgi:hypothetical protein
MDEIPFNTGLVHSGQALMFVEQDLQGPQFSQRRASQASECIALLLGSAPIHALIKIKAGPFIHSQWPQSTPRGHGMRATRPIATKAVSNSVIAAFDNWSKLDAAVRAMNASESCSGPVIWPAGQVDGV